MNKWWIKRQTGHTTGLLLLSKMELTGTGFTFHLENNQNKPIQDLWNKGSSKTRHHTMKVSDLWEIGNKWGKPYTCLDLLPLQSFWASQRERKPKQSLADSLIWGEGPPSAGRPKQLAFPMTAAEKKAVQMEELPRCAEGPLCFQPSNDQHMHIRKPPKAGGQVRGCWNYSKG